MGIRVEHQPSAGVVGMAAYYTGARGAKLRQQKYAMEAAQQNQAIQARREGQFMDFKYNQALNQQRQAELAARDKRLHEWDVEAAGDRVEVERDMFELRERREESREGERRKYEAEEYRRRADEARDEWVSRGMTTGELVPNPAAQTALKTADDEYAKAAASGMYTRDQLDNYRRELDEWKRRVLRHGVQAPDAMTEFGRNAVVRDPSAPGGIRKPRQGEAPTDTLRNGELVTIQPSAEEQKQEEQRQEDLKTRQQEQANREKRRFDLQKRRDKIMTTTAVDPNDKKEMLRGIDDEMESLQVEEGMDNPAVVSRLTAQWQHAYGMTPSREQIAAYVRQNVRAQRTASQPTQKPAQTATSSESPKPQSQPGSSKPLPDGAPSGSQWIDDNTIRLPDGTEIRPKG